MECGAMLSKEGGMKRCFAVILVRRIIWVRQVVYIDFDIATFIADPFSEGSLNELLSMSGIGSYVGVLLQLIPGCSRPRIICQL